MSQELHFFGKGLFPTCTHPMTSDIGNRWCCEAEQSLKCASLDISWKIMESEDKQSIVAPIQLSTDKSLKSLKAGLSSLHSSLDCFKLLRGLFAEVLLPATVLLSTFAGGIQIFRDRINGI